MGPLGGVFILSRCELEEDIAPWIEVTFTAQASSFEEVKVIAENEGTGFSQKIKKLKVFNGNEELIIPKESLEDIRNARLDTMMISSEAGYDKFPWLYVSFVLGSPAPGVEWDFPRIYFAFQDNKFVKRFATKARKGGGREFIENWKPIQN